jgi:membrane-associated phospholipid phosphatase
MAFAATTSLLLYLHRQASSSSSSSREESAATWRTPAAARGSSSSSGKATPLVDRLARAVQLLEVQLLAGLTLAVAYGRIYLGYHTPGQVAAGLALGAAVAAVWWHLTLAVCQRWGAALPRLAPLRALHFRNTLGCPDVHAAEAALFAGSAAAQHVD